MSVPKSTPAPPYSVRSASSDLNVPSSSAALDHGTFLRRGHVAAALRLLLREVRRGQQAAGELVRRPHVDQVLVADRADDLVAERADRGVLLAGRVAGRGPLRHLGDQLAGVQLPLLPAAVEQLDVLVPVEPEVPVRVGGEPVVVAAVQDHGVVVGDAALGQQRLEARPVDEVTADRVLQVLLPVDLHGPADVALVVSAGVLVDLDQDDAGVVLVRLDPVSVHQDVGTAHAQILLAYQPGLAMSPGWVCSGRCGCWSARCWSVRGWVSLRPALASAWPGPADASGTSRTPGRGQTPRSGSRPPGPARRRPCPSGVRPSAIADDAR